MFPSVTAYNGAESFTPVVLVGSARITAKEVKSKERSSQAARNAIYARNRALYACPLSNVGNLAGIGRIISAECRQLRADPAML